MSRKALFFDIDGTLFSEINREVPASALRAVTRARELGHLAFINTGRTYCITGLIRSLIEMDGYLCGCGTRVIAGGEVLYSHTIPHDRGNQIKKDILFYGLDGVLEGTEACYFHKEPFKNPEIIKLRNNLIHEGALSEYTWDEDCYDFDKFCVMMDKWSDVPGFVRALGLEFDVIDRGIHFLECVPAGHSKATAIECILERYGIPLKDAYVFGDSMNDMPMFEYAENTVLMGHHDRELEPFAKFTTKNVEDDGIEYAMKKLGLI